MSLPSFTLKLISKQTASENDLKFPFIIVSVLVCGKYIQYLG